MELSLAGACCILLLFNPVVFIYTYLWLASVAGAVFFLSLAAVVYEAVLTGLLRAVPQVVVYLADIRLDARLPLRAAIRIFLCTHELGVGAMVCGASAMTLVMCSICTILKRLSARSTIPLISIIVCVKSVHEHDVWMFSMSSLTLASVLSGWHLSCGCAPMSQTLRYSRLIAFCRAMDASINP